MLADGIRKLGLPASTATGIRQFRLYGELLLKWNSTYNLLGATSSEAIVQEHLLDSVAVHPVLKRWLPHRQAVTDVGSGAGFPGMVLAIMEPDRTFVLVEPIGKKAAFLRQAVAHCGLTNVRVVEGRIEDLGAQAEVPHFICRAFTSLVRFTQLCAPTASACSLYFAMKAVRVSAELQDLDPGMEVLAVELLPMPVNKTERRLVVMRLRPDNVTTDPLRSV